MRGKKTMRVWQTERRSEDTINLWAWRLRSAATPLLHVRMPSLRHSKKARFVLHGSGPCKLQEDVKDPESICRECRAVNLALTSGLCARRSDTIGSAIGSLMCSGPSFDTLVISFASDPVVPPLCSNIPTRFGPSLYTSPIRLQCGCCVADRGHDFTLLRFLELTTMFHAH
jgi:hypothetical protein